MTGTIQGGIADILTSTKDPLALTYTNAQSITLFSYTHSAYVSYSAGGLQAQSSRFKLQKVNDPGVAGGPDGLTITFSTPSSGTLYFASANAAEACDIALWSLDCGSKGGLY